MVKTEFKEWKKEEIQQFLEDNFITEGSPYETLDQLYEALFKDADVSLTVEELKEEENCSQLIIKIKLREC